jgi:hypothetical protein
MIKALDISEDINGLLYDATLYLISKYVELWFNKITVSYRLSNT